MIELPAELAGPLEIPGAASSNLWQLVLAALVTLWLLIRPLRGRKPVQMAPTAPPPPPAPVEIGSIGQAIRALRKKHLASTLLRQGCHELSALLREHYEKAGLDDQRSAPITKLTALELRRRLGETPFTRLFVDLAALQFSSRLPSRKAFRHVCHWAIQLVESK